MRKYEFDEFLSDIERLCDKLRETKVDGIAFVARGGASMAHFLAVRLGIRKMYAINAYSYEGQKKLHTPIIDELPNLSGLREILLVDEIVDSGETLQAVSANIKKCYPDIEIVSVALFQRESAVVKATHFLHTTEEWVEFFWERGEGALTKEKPKQH